MGGNPEEEVWQRGYDSVTDDDEEGHGIEYAMGDDAENERKSCRMTADYAFADPCDFI